MEKALLDDVSNHEVNETLPIATPARPEAENGQLNTFLARLKRHSSFIFLMITVISILFFSTCEYFSGSKCGDLGFIILLIMRVIIIGFLDYASQH